MAMDCTPLKKKLDQLEEQIAFAKSQGDTPEQLNRLTSQAWAYSIDYFDCMAGNTTLQTVINLNGKWASGGVPGPVITVTGNALTIDMSAYGRPAAKGAILDVSDIWANFQDDNVYTGKLVAPNEIVWSNNSTWTKA
jgi:hypothetical protein